MKNPRAPTREALENTGEIPSLPPRLDAMAKGGTLHARFCRVKKGGDGSTSMKHASCGCRAPAFEPHHVAGDVTDPRMKSGAWEELRVADESDRARLINDISRLIREPLMPESTRTAGLTLIGWLARRMPGECPHALGVAEARESERMVKTARRRAR